MASKTKNHIIIVICICYICSCEPIHQLKISPDCNFSKEITFSCGKVIIKGKLVAFNDFVIENMFEVSKPSILNRDSLFIEHKVKTMPYRLFLDGKEIKSSQVQITNGKNYVLSFSIDNSLLERGDTVTIKDLGYLYCDSSRVKIGNINLIVDF